MDDAQSTRSLRPRKGDRHQHEEPLLAMGTRRAKGIPASVVDKLQQRLILHVAERWGARVSIAIRTRGLFAYVDAHGPEAADFEPLLRLRYLGDVDLWEFGYFTWAKERYEQSFLTTGLPFGTPEECFHAASLGNFTDP